MKEIPTNKCTCRSLYYTRVNNHMVFPQVKVKHNLAGNLDRPVWRRLETLALKREYVRLILVKRKCSGAT